MLTALLREGIKLGSDGRHRSRNDSLVEGTQESGDGKASKD